MGAFFMIRHGQYFLPDGGHGRKGQKQTLVFLFTRRITSVKKTKVSKRTVTELLDVRSRNLTSRIRYRKLPRHIFVYCRSRNIAARFLADAEAEGFTFGDGGMPTKKEYNDIYSLHADLTISYTGLIGHTAFRNAAGNIVRIDYGKYIAGAKDFQSFPSGRNEFSRK